ncbi:uncharacterized protein LOC114381539 [Glycine soja]|uniref:uncharacterized protein n=1 Tax=Glycine max TaxID=3847 RepID=UPI0003DE7D70|nr:uncharacterized protein LOC102663406 [Glycine max]XP_028196616.1 uncharacterized protein LOC114381539 [Glycine soja]|eukprot:XP_006595327.1 uncharacterized protein LOC102663406 [Glycine max]
MENDCCFHVRKCHKCQAFVDNVNALLVPLNILTAPWPFSMWGIDVIGAIEPKALNRHGFILVAIDYFTKWVEAASYANVTRSVVVRFIKKEIIYRWRLCSFSPSETNAFAHLCWPFRTPVEGQVVTVGDSAEDLLES